jgi:ubiquinone biosynthesis protein
VVAALIISAALLADQSLLLAGIVLAFAGIALIPRWN